MSDLNTTSIKEIIQTITNQTQVTKDTLSKEEITNLMRDEFLGHIEALNSNIEIFLMIVTSFGAIYSILIGFNFLSTKKIKQEVKEEVKKYITEEIDEKSREIDKNIKRSILKNQQASQKDEYLRNLIFYDLSKILASDINDLGETDLRKVFNLYSTRLLVATQLTSGDEKQIQRALKMLSLSAYSTFISLTSVQNYIKTLALRDDLDIEEELLNIKKSMVKENSIF